MLETLKHIHVRIKEGMLKDMIRQTNWIYQYARHYWLAMIFYTALGLFGTVVGLGSSVVSKDLVDIITGHQTGKLVQTFCLMVGLSISNTLVSQITKLCVQLDQYESRCGNQSGHFLQNAGHRLGIHHKLSYR